MWSTYSAAHVERVFARAALGTATWFDAMDEVAIIGRSYGAVIQPVTGKQTTFPSSRSLLEATEAFVKEGWIHQDVRGQCLPALLRNGVCSDEDYITPDEMDRHPYYQDFLARFGLRWFAAVKLSAGEECWALSFERTAAQGHYGIPELQTLASLGGRLGSAVAISSALGFAKAEGVSLAFQESGLAAFMLDRQGQVILANMQAERLLGEDVKITQRRIRSYDREVNAALDRVIHDLLWRPDKGACSDPVALPRKTGGLIYAYAMVVDGINRDVLSPCRAIVVIVDPSHRPRPAEEALKHAFGLTLAEARLAARMAQGHSIDAVADDLQIAHGTARNHLKSVFSKLGVSRQADLVAMILSFTINYQSD